MNTTIWPSSGIRSNQLQRIETGNRRGFCFMKLEQDFASAGFGGSNAPLIAPVVSDWHDFCETSKTPSDRFSCQVHPKERPGAMPRGDKSKYTEKQKRQAEHIEESYESRGVSKPTAEKRAWATVNKISGGGKKSGGGRKKPG